MVSIKEALKIIQNQPVEVNTQVRNLNDCLGFSISKAIRAPFDMPSFNNSAMDGYALSGISKEYTIVTEVAAGETKQFRLQTGEAARIFTGAKIPENTSAVMMQEKTRLEGKKLYLEDEPKEGQSIRRKAAEFSKGEVVFETGYTITPAGIGVIGSLGLNKVEVYKKPKINLITTGNELIAPGKNKLEGQIYDSNRFALAAACQKYDFPCKYKGQIEDDFKKIKAEIKSSLETADILILSGGISVGDYDFVKQALEENGVREQFYKVFQKPGKPLYFGRKENTFVFALPGNPASSLSCFYIYVLPMLYKLSKSEKSSLASYYFPISQDFENTADRPSFLKAKIRGGEVEVLNGQSSSMIQSMALGNALAFVDAETIVKKGNLVKCFLLS